MPGRCGDRERVKAARVTFGFDSEWSTYAPKPGGRLVSACKNSKISLDA